MIENNGNRLKFTKMDVDIGKLKQIVTAQMTQGSKNPPGYPIAIIKYVGGRKKIILDSSDLMEEWPNSDSDCVI